MINTLKVKSRIVELGITQESVANYLGLDYSTLNLKINNKRRTYIDELVKLCEILQINKPDDLKIYFGLDFIILPNTCEKESE